MEPNKISHNKQRNNKSNKEIAYQNEKLGLASKSLIDSKSKMLLQEPKTICVTGYLQPSSILHWNVFLASDPLRLWGVFKQVRDSLHQLDIVLSSIKHIDLKGSIWSIKAAHSNFRDIHLQYKERKKAQNGKLQKPHATVPRMQVVVVVTANSRYILLQKTRHTSWIPSAIIYCVIDLVLL